MDNLKFAETLKELIEENKLTHQDIEKATGTSNGNVSMWINQKVVPALPGLVRLSTLFNCSIDYLLNRTDDKASCKPEIVSSLDKRLKELAQEKGKSLGKIAVDLKINETNLYRWARGKTLPSLNNLLLLADYFNCSVDYLIGRND